MATVRIQVRRGLASEWTSANPILAAGELGVESDTNLFKFGNGSTAWTSLAYANNSDVAIGEISQDAINTALTMGSGLTKTYNDGSNTITIAVDASYFNELAQDAVNTALTAGTGITKTYDDAANTLTVAVDSTIATKAYADAAVTTHDQDTTSVHGIQNTADLVYLTGSQTISGKTLSDVVLTGTPTAPTQAANDNSTKVATTAYVQTELADLIGTAPALLDTLGELSDALNDNENYAAAMTTTITGINNSLANKVATSDFTAHATDSTDVHGISNTANLVYTSDSRLSDNRTPINGSVVVASMAVDSITTPSITDAAVTTAKIADDAVTAAKIAASAVGTSEISDDAVTAAKIAAAAVGTSEIADDAVTAAKIATGSVGPSEIATDAVGSDHIASGAVGTSEISDDAVTAAKIAAAAVGTSEIADDAVTSVKITDLNVTTAKINDSAVTEGKIAAGAVTSGKIADGAIVDADVNASAAIAQSKISGLTTDLGLKAPLDSPTFTGTVTLPAGTVTSGMILDGTITDADINATAGIAQSKISGLTTDLSNKLASTTAASTYAPLASPALTGTPTAPTAAAGTSTTQVATTAFVGTAVADLVASAPAALNTLNELATALGNDASFSTTITNAIALKSPLASPTFTGTLTAPAITATGLITASASGIAFTDGTQTKEGVPSRTVIGTTISAAYNLSTGGLALRDQLIPISGAQAITVPTNATTAYPIGTSISFYQASGSGANFVFASGVTPLATPGQTLRALSSSATLTKVATDTWLLAGDLRA